MHPRVWFLVPAIIAAGSTPSMADDGNTVPPGFAELGGTWGVQFGEQSYVPDGAPGSSEHPFTKGFGGNVTAGYGLTAGIALMADYGYSRASSRRGNVDMALEEVQGSISYHTIDAGLRLHHRAGPGSLYAEFALGVVLPFETELEYTYAPELSALGITGDGSMVDEYNIGFGGHGEMGYQFPLGSRAYIGTGLRIESYESNNDGKPTRLDNFVTDFAMPTPVTAEINHGTTRAATPTAYSVQSIRLHLDVGARF